MSRFIRSPRTWSAVVCAALLALIVTMTVSAQRPQQAVAANGVITGTVQGERGPEAGVWVIAETKDLPTKFVKIVVTDDRGPCRAVCDSKSTSILPSRIRDTTSTVRRSTALIRAASSSMSNGFVT